jgi:hypothetical protein
MRDFATSLDEKSLGGHESTLDRAPDQPLRLGTLLRCGTVLATDSVPVCSRWALGTPTAEHDLLLILAHTPLSDLPAIRAIPLLLANVPRDSLIAKFPRSALHDGA